MYLSSLTTYIFDNFEAVPPVTLWTRSCESSVFSSSNCFSRSSFDLVLSSCAFSFPYRTKRKHPSLTTSPEMEHSSPLQRRLHGFSRRPHHFTFHACTNIQQEKSRAPFAHIVLTNAHSQKMVVEKSTVVRWISTACLLLFLSVPPTLGNGSSCLDLGFSSNLLCSSCRELKEFGLEALEEECQRCCQVEGTVDDDYVRNNVAPEIHSNRPERVENLCNLY